MLEISNINPVNKGSLMATCSVRIGPWKTTFHEIKIFEKGANRWLGLPAREFISDTGEKKYIELVTFDCEAVKNRFRQQVMEAVDAFIANNPDMVPEDVIKMEDNIPF